MSATIEMIKSMLTIEDGLEKYAGVDLSKVNSRKKSFNICCPFHHDKHPSFTVWRATNSWKCWSGCGSGDVINLVALVFNISNRQAIQKIVRDLGIRGPKGNNKPAPEYVHKAQKREIEKGVLAEFDNRYNEAFYRLLAIEKEMMEQKRNVKSIEEAEEKSFLYHYLPYVSYLLEQLTEGSFTEQIDAVLIAERLLKGG